MRPFKVLFVNAVNPYVESQNRYPALGLGYLVAMLRREFGDRVDIHLVEARVENEIRNWQPDLLAISSVSQNYSLALRYAGLGRETGIPVVVGGYQVTEVPGSLSRDMNVGVIGEGDYTICEVVEILLEEGSLPTSRLASVTGIVFWDGDELVYTPPREVAGKKTKSLDELPMPARDLMRVRRHTNMLTSRGCPYTCGFCASTRFWPNIRYFSPEVMIEEIRSLQRNYGVNYITFQDDLFIANVKRLEAFHELVMREGLPGEGMRFACSSSATLITDHMAKLLKDMNFVSVMMGLESGNQEVLTRLKGRAFSVENNRIAIETLNRHGILAHGYFIIGEPQETLEQMEETYEFMRTMPLSVINISPLIPLPGTPVWHRAVERGLVSEDMDWSQLNIQFELGWRRTTLLSEVVTREELYRMYRKMHGLRKRKLISGLFYHPMRSELLYYTRAKAVEWLHRVRAPVG